MKKSIHWYGWLCALVWTLSLSCLPAQIPPELREQGVLYFEGNLPDKIIATIHVTTTVYLHRDFAAVLASFEPDQEIELIGMSSEGYLLQANYRNNTVVGWIRPEDLPTGIDPTLFKLAQKNQVRHDAVTAAIANKSVIQGMTSAEVKKSVGRPEQISSHTDDSGSVLTWIFTTYREEPQYSYVLDAWGRPQLQTYYVKIPIGQLIVNFQNDAVVSVEEHKTDSRSAGILTN